MVTIHLPSRNRTRRLKCIIRRTCGVPDCCRLLQLLPAPCAGVAYCQIFDIMHPGRVPMHKLICKPVVGIAFAALLGELLVRSRCQARGGQTEESRDPGDVLPQASDSESRTRCGIRRAFLRGFPAFALCSRQSSQGTFRRQSGLPTLLPSLLRLAIFRPRSGL